MFDDLKEMLEVPQALSDWSFTTMDDRLLNPLNFGICTRLNLPIS
jgi:hypothetical protein